MNFKFGRFFTLLINFILGTFFLIVGLVAILLPWFPDWQQAIIDFILNQHLILFLFGISFCLIGLSAFVYAFFSTQHQFISLETGNHAITVDESVIEAYLNSYFAKKFPQATIPFTFYLKKNVIQVQAHFPFLPIEEQKNFMETIQKELTQLFNELLGPSQTIDLIASFDPSNK